MLVTFILLIPPVPVIAAGIACGFVMLQFKFTEQLLAPDAMVQDGEDGVRVPDMESGEKLAVTVQLLVIAPVV